MKKTKIGVRKPFTTMNKMEGKLRKPNFHIPLENKLPLPYLPFPDALVMPCQHAINVDRHSSKKLQAGARLSPRAHRYTAN